MRYANRQQIPSGNDNQKSKGNTKNIPFPTTPYNPHANPFGCLI